MDLTILNNRNSTTLACTKLQTKLALNDYRTGTASDTTVTSLIVGPSRVPPTRKPMPEGMRLRVVSGSKVRHQRLRQKQSLISLAQPGRKAALATSWRETMASQFTKPSPLSLSHCISCDCQSPDATGLADEQKTSTTVVVNRIVSCHLATGK
jgi:hypothetical protein